MDIFFFYTVNPDDDEPIMLIDRHLGFNEADGYGIMGDLFQKELLALDTMEKKRIQVWINCPGGSVTEGYNIYNAMLKTKTKVDTYCFGMAASMGGVIFEAGRKRVMTDYAWLMFHNPQMSDGSSGDYELLKTYTESIAKMIASRCGKTEDEIKSIMKKETFIMADEALAEGLCDQVQASGEQNRKRTMPVDTNAFWREANKVVNSLLPTTIQINRDMKKVANKLKLNSEASEDSIVAEIESVQNKVTTLEGQVDNHLKTIEKKDKEIQEVKNQLQAKENELTQVQNKLTEVENKAKKEAEEKAEKEKTEKAQKAKDLVTGHVAAGRIQNKKEVIDSWTKKAEEDYESVKTMLEGLTVNRQQPQRIETQNRAEVSKLTSVVRNTMANKLQQMEAKSK
jgi:ATP-dependent Clp endopeptidase proteolytic subunit ClpP